MMKPNSKQAHEKGRGGTPRKEGKENADLALMHRTNSEPDFSVRSQLTVTEGSIDLGAERQAKQNSVDRSNTAFPEH